MTASHMIACDGRTPSEFNFRPAAQKTLDNPEPKKYPTSIPGRGSSRRGEGRFERIQRVTDWEQVNDPELLDELQSKIKTEYLKDDSKTIVSQNNSPDVDFNFSLNPYRGCVHGCSYCYARPTHEYLGFNAGLDFESKIVVKHDTPELFRKWLSRPKWAKQVEPIMISGVSDCYQPCEREYELTRCCLEVALNARQPIRITTKNALIRRDIDLLSELAKLNLVFVTVSLTSLDQSLIRIMEPRSSSPKARLATIKTLASAGIPVRVLVAPIIPAVNDEEIPSILQASVEAGAKTAQYVVLRLPLSVEPVFIAWLERHFPDRRDKIVDRIKSLRDGKMYDSSFGNRMKGKGIWADQIRILFQTCCHKYGLDQKTPQLDCTRFRKPSDPNQQMLF